MIEISIIGAGKMSSHYLSYLNNHKKKYRIKGIYSRTQEKCLYLKNKYKQLKIYSNLDLLIEEKPQLIIIAVNEESLISILKVTLKSKIVHLIEKPLGINNSQFIHLDKIIKLNKTRIFISLNRRYYSSIKKLDEIKDLSVPYNLKIIDHQIPKNINNKSKSDKVKKYWMYSNAVHLVDLISFFSKNKIKLKYRKKILIDHEKKIYISTFKLKNNSIITYICFWNIEGRMSIELNSAEINSNLKPIEEITIMYKNKINIYKEPQIYKPGFIGLFNNIDLFFKDKKHTLVSNYEYSKTIKLIKYIYGV